MNKKWLEILFNIFFWLISSWLIISFFSIESLEILTTNGEVVENITRNNTLISIFILGQFLFGFYFYTQLYIIQKLTKGLATRRIIIHSIFIGLAVFCIYYALVQLFILKRPMHFFFPTISYAIFVFYMAISIGYGFIKVWIKNEQDKNQLQLINNQAELNLLRTQLHPHFLFNTMNNLLSMVDQKNNPKLAKSIDKLSGLLRYVVYDIKNKKVTIANEIDFIQNFVELNLLRFEDNEIDYKLTIIGEYNQQFIEPGILLCYVENAFKHGVQPEVESFIHIEIDISEQKSIHFKIENYIPPEIGIKKKSGYGLRSNLNRLQLAYSNKYKLQITEENKYIVSLRINTNEGNNS